MTWQEAYNCFEYIASKYKGADTDQIEKEVDMLYSIMRGFEPFDKAYQKWIEPVD